MIGRFMLPYRHPLLQEWLAILTICLVSIGGAFIRLRQIWSDQPATYWAIGALLFVAYPLVILRNYLRYHRPSLDVKRYPRLGRVIWMAMLRGLLLAFLAGFAFSGPGEGWLRWLPGIFMFTSVGLGLLCDWLNREACQVSILERTLRTHLWAMGFLVGSIVIVRFELMAFWVLIVGIAQYIFLYTIWLRNRGNVEWAMGTPQLLHRVQGFAVLLWVGLTLLPIYSSRVTTILGLFLFIPYLLGFIAEYQAAAGKPVVRFMTSPPVWLGQWLPLFPRLVLVVSALGMYISGLIQGMNAGRLVFLGAIAIWALIGAIGRLTGVVTVLLVGFILSHGGGWLEWCAFLSGGLLMVLGSGKFSVWQPEDSVIGLDIHEET
ncbi:MAG: hypothetical protein GYA80_04940 [Chloroflexi bacterium]|nr:hypothetical protein [Chloroflexota bacterium]